ncbi:HAD family hydrolase [Chloroflexi bacterium TSY]|nr:HAD family hydrolase [Chloroflexi bacterium TSY]
MVEAVLFDLDETLLDRTQSLTAFARQQYSKYQALHKVAQSLYVSRFIELDANGHVWKDVVYQQLENEFEIVDLSWQILLQDYVETFQHSCIGFPGLEAMLDKLKKVDIRLGIITNGRSPFQENNIKALGIESYFQTILVSETEGIRKPDPEIFQRALRHLRVDPSGAVFVGDNPNADIAGAQRAGMRAIWRYNRHYGNCEFADAVCYKLSEVVDVIEDVGKDTSWSATTRKDYRI